MYNEIEGDLIQLALQGKFDVIAHGCNCFCTMGAGIAPQMAKAFGCDGFPGEEHWRRGDINKLGTMEYHQFFLINGIIVDLYENMGNKEMKELFVVNAYTQYGFGANHKEGIQKPIDYEALTLCMRKMNNEFEGMHIGLPMIGAGLAGGDWERIKNIIQTELNKCDVTVVIYKP